MPRQGAQIPLLSFRLAKPVHSLFRMPHSIGCYPSSSFISFRKRKQQSANSDVLRALAQRLQLPSGTDVVDLLRSVCFSISPRWSILLGGGQARAQQFTRPLCRPGELEAAWRAAGFEDVVQTTVMTRMEFSNFEDYWTPYLGKQAGGAAYVATLTEERREVLKEALRLAYLDGEPDGPRSYAPIAWAVKGTVPSYK